MTSDREHLSTSVQRSRRLADAHTMSRRPTLLDRFRAALGGRREPQVLVLVNTTRGQRAVPVPARELRRPRGR